ncbi:MipA/OmpV family protein [Alteraurantiacibacter buctensis]|uniref:MipA/OmpV family protein n=1 Tax=Alteraurantiacibacter buctensis TaxID=1503981 RepID=UPI0034DEA505
MAAEPFAGLFHGCRSPHLRARRAECHLRARCHADYYFGVSPTGALASGLAPFDPDGGLESLGANVLATHSLSGGRKGWSVFGIASFSRLQGDFARSPIVRDAGSADQVFGSVGVGYTF